MSKNKALNVILTNDDGIFAPGLWALYKALQSEHRLFVVAPDRERSAVSHGITLHRPLRATEITVNGGYKGFAVNGTPADCVKLAVRELLDQHPDVVISGINPGANVGVNLNYSGTVAAAKEAALNGLKAIAVSIQASETPHFEAAAAFIARMLPLVTEHGLPRGTFINVNVPDVAFEDLAGVCISRQSNDLFDEYFEKRIDLRNRVYYWQGGEMQPYFRQADADGAALRANYISITPVRCDMTDYDAMERLKKWEFDGLPKMSTETDASGIGVLPGAADGEERR